MEVGGDEGHKNIDRPIYPTHHRKPESVSTPFALFSVTSACEKPVKQLELIS